MILEKPQVYVEQIEPIKIMKNIERAMRTCYRTEGSITDDSYKRLIAKSINSGHGSVMEHEKITVKLRCSVGTYKDLTRHRVGTAWSIESTRWCNYSKERFEGLHYINPEYMNDDAKELWIEHMHDVEEKYFELAAMGCKPDELRTILPHATAADVVMTCNIREWRHILNLRTKKDVHPEIRQLLIPLLLKFKYLMPELFDDIDYDRDFPMEWYAQVGILE